MNIPFQYITRLFVAAIVAVSPAFIFAQSVDAVDDIAHTTKNKSVTIDPLANDKGTGLYIKDIVLENHGKARIVNGKIVFTPDADFKGAGLLNYTTCNALNECSCGLVIVDINEAILPVYQEMKIFVADTNTTKFTLPGGFTEVSQATNGTGTIGKESATGEWLFKAPIGYKGVTRRMFEITDVDNTRKSFEVEFEVLPASSKYAVPDLFSVRPGQRKVPFNVSLNDIGEKSIISFGPCTGGIIETSNNDGSFEFTPSVGEGGKASFNYTITVNGKTETTTATIIVSNYFPSKDQYQLASSGLALAIPYPAPVEGYRFEVWNNGNTQEGGKVNFYSNNIDTTIYANRIAGKNLLLYVPPTSRTDAFTDVFYVKYCVDNNTCSDPIEVRVFVKERLTNEPPCIGTCVWPGDTNGDGLVNIMDLFPIANSMGQYGKPRSDVGSELEWYPHGGTNWGKDIYGRDMKHADANGDGVVTAKDVEAIIENYGNNSTITPLKTAEESNIEIQLVSSSSSLIPGDMVEMIVSMGSSENPAFNTKGVSFSLDYDANQIKENTISTDFSAFNWLSRYDAYLSLSKIAERGKLDAGLVRSKGKGANGHGQVGIVRAVIEDNITGFRGDEKTMLKFRLKNAYMMGENGQPVQLQTKDLEIPIKLGKKADVLKAEDLVMYPNPASDQVNFHINGVNKIDYVRIMDGAGREVIRLNKIDAKSASIPVGDLRGFYIAEVMTEKGRVVKKLEIFK
jgi:hypothetical protein